MRKGEQLLKVFVEKSPLDSMICRFCHRADSMEFIVATSDYHVSFCKDCQIYQTFSLVPGRIPERPWDHKTWHLMSRLSQRRVVRERTELLKRVLSLIDYQPYGSLRMLDVGAGTGDLSLAARNLGVGSVVAMDISPLNCRSIRRLGIPAVQADAENMPFRAGSFDVVTMCQLIEHIEYPQRVLEQAFSMLRPGGVLHVDMPCPDNVFARLTKYRMGSSFGPEHMTLFTKDSLAHLVESVGFEIVGFRGYTNSFHLAGLLVYALTGLRHKKTWSRAAAEELVSLGTSEELLSQDLVSTERSVFVRRLRDGIVLANWGLRMGVGYVIAPAWNPIAKLLSQRTDTLAFMEMQARRPSVTKG